MAACWSPRSPATEMPASVPFASPYTSDDDRICGQHRPGNADRRAQVVVPVERLQVHQHRAAGVGHVGHVRAAVGPAREVPDAPGVDVAEHQVAGLGPRARAVDVVEDPAHLGPGEVRGERQTGLLAEPVLPAVRRQRVDDVLLPRVLPHERVVDGLARVPVPDDRRLALVRDADRGEVARRDARPSSARRRSPPASAPRSPSGRARPNPASGRSARAPSGRPPTTLPLWSKIMKRVLVVPWSRAPT